jgi:hypothetical protein
VHFRENFPEYFRENFRGKNFLFNYMTKPSWRPYIAFFYFFGLFRSSCVCYGCFEMDPKHRNKPNQPEKIVISFANQTENQPKQFEFRFVSVQSEKKIFCLFLGHPSLRTERRITMIYRICKLLSCIQ